MKTWPSVKIIYSWCAIYLPSEIRILSRKCFYRLFCFSNVFLITRNNYENRMCRKFYLFFVQLFLVVFHNDNVWKTVEQENYILWRHFENYNFVDNISDLHKISYTYDAVNLKSINLYYIIIVKCNMEYVFYLVNRVSDFLTSKWSYTKRYLWIRCLCLRTFAKNIKTLCSCRFIFFVYRYRVIYNYCLRWIDVVHH